MRKILSIDAGGVRGIIPATILAEVEARTEQPVCNLFDFFAGTSSGGMLVLALNCPDASGYPRPLCSAGEVAGLFHEWGDRPFRSKVSNAGQPIGEMSSENGGSTGFAPIMNHANMVLSELVVAGLISAEERGRMTLASCPRRERDLLAPFAEHGQFQGLVVEHCSTAVGADTAWDEYQLDKDAKALARKRALFFRAIFVPSLAQALKPSRGAKQRQAFGAALAAGLWRRLVDYPVGIEHLVGMMVDQR